MIVLVYWVLNDTSNNMSPGSMIIFHGLNSTLIKTVEYHDFIDHPSKKFSYDTTTKNNLDYLKIKLIRTTQFLGSTGAHIHQLSQYSTIQEITQAKKWYQCKSTRIWVMNLIQNTEDVPYAPWPWAWG